MIRVMIQVKLTERAMDVMAVRGRKQSVLIVVVLGVSLEQGSDLEQNRVGFWRGSIQEDIRSEYLFRLE